VPEKPYSPEWVPFKNGAIGGQFGRRFAGGFRMSLYGFGRHWGLDLHHPLSVEVLDGPPVHPNRLRLADC